MSSHRRTANPRAFYLELSALGIDPTTGAVPPLDLSCGEIVRLMLRLRENRAGLCAVIAGVDDPDLQAVRGEGAV